MTNEATTIETTKPRNGIERRRGHEGDIVTYQGISDTWKGWAKRIGITDTAIYKRQRQSKSLRAILRPRDKASGPRKPRAQAPSATVVEALTSPVTPKAANGSNGHAATAPATHPAAALLRAAGYAVEVIDAPKLILVVERP